MGRSTSHELVPVLKDVCLKSVCLLLRAAMPRQIKFNIANLHKICFVLITKSCNLISIHPMFLPTSYPVVSQGLLLPLDRSLVHHSPSFTITLNLESPIDLNMQSMFSKPIGNKQCWSPIYPAASKRNRKRISGIIILELS